jgi:hypothetical protein
VTVRATCDKAEDEACSIGPALHLDVIGSGIIAHDPLLFVAGVGDRLESAEFYGGVTVSGAVFFCGHGRDRPGLQAPQRPLHCRGLPGPAVGPACQPTSYGSNQPLERPKACGGAWGRCPRSPDPSADTLTRAGTDSGPAG